MGAPAILVTDATHFIGPAVVDRLAAGGARVIAADASFGDPDAARAFEAAHTVRAVPQGSPEATVAAASSVHGGLDALVVASAYPAGRTPAAGLTADVTRPYFEKLAMEPLAVFAAALPHLIARRGRAVFVTSAGPIGGIPGFGAYAAARAAISGAVRTLALELAADGVSVNAVAPNFIQTETYYPKALLADPVKGPRLLARVPLGRLGDAAEAAEAVAFFALGNSGFVTGQVLNVSGGSS